MHSETVGWVCFSPGSQTLGWEAAMQPPCACRGRGAVACYAGLGLRTHPQQSGGCSSEPHTGHKSFRLCLHAVNAARMNSAEEHCWGECVCACAHARVRAPEAQVLLCPILRGTSSRVLLKFATSPEGMTPCPLHNPVEMFNAQPLNWGTIQIS